MAPKKKEKEEPKPAAPKPPEPEPPKEPEFNAAEVQVSLAPVATGQWSGIREREFFCNVLLAGGSYSCFRY